MKSCQDIRREFIEFFQRRGHTFVPSSPLLPAEDPTLLFTNAGMNQFKDIFLGRETRDYRRAANSQKCIRAGGKHNDLEDVGHDVYHHTFFEMLGNWSFGDYFKREAIQWAWELLTGAWGLDKRRLYATVFAGDEAARLPPDSESKALWPQVTDLPLERVVGASAKDNFWAPGETGPCGVNSEVLMDLGPEACDGSRHPGKGCRINLDGCSRFLEIWNLVFIQFNRDDSGILNPLPLRHVDTGMGFERICRILQGKKSNYATDLWVPIIEKIETLTAHRYGVGSGLEDRFDVASEKDIADVACRVVADHARALTFAITDGVIPSNEGRGYVLRRILRRAARYGRQYLQIDGPFISKLVPTIVDLMGDAFPEMRDRRKYVVETIAQEEESFGRTLDRGIDLFQRQADRLAQAGAKELPGDVAFDLYATYGFPLDLTQVMASERGMSVDLPGYEKAMAAHREVSGAGEAFQAVEVADLPASSDDSAKYSRQPAKATVLGWVAGPDGEGRFVAEGELQAGAEAAVVLDRTNFYGEQGGQVGDAGYLQWAGGKFAVQDTRLAGGSVFHIGVVEKGTLSHGQTVRTYVAPSRLDTMRNHTATHLLNWALREVLGDHVNQAGSVVAPDRLRFDFTHNQQVTAEQLAQAERLVNERILADQPVAAVTMPLAEARKVPGVRAVFGEKYPDPVRVICIGGRGSPASAGTAVSAEFCGGTHLKRTGQVGLFKIVSEESVAKGVRRITALTGLAAADYVQQIDGIVKAASLALRVAPGELPGRVEALLKEVKQLRKAPAASKAKEGFEPTETIQTPAGEVLIGEVAGGTPPDMRNLCDQLRQKGAAAAMLGSRADGKVTLIAMVSDEVVKTGKLAAGDWVKAAAEAVGGTGGGRPTLAQAGGKPPEKLPDALALAGQYARQKLT